jgi:hypothetical protein
VSHTHTYVTLEISAAAYDEIAMKLRAASYGQCFNSTGEIDMTGIAVTRGPKQMTVESSNCYVPANSGEANA